MTLRLAGSTSGYTEIDCPSVGGNNTLVLPTGNGSSGQVLSTNGSGALSWVDRMTAAGPAFSASSTVATSATTGSSTKITFDSEVFDTANCFASSRFTPNVAGYYQFTALVSYGGASSGGLFVVSFAKNGSVISEGVVTFCTEYNKPWAGQLISLNGSSDYVEVFAAQYSGSTRNLGGQAFSAFLARPA
jgi:hypothetical protein